MSSDYQFVSTDPEALVTLLIAGYEGLTGTAVTPGSPERLFILWVADVIIQTRAQINFAANQNIPSRASGENLDALGELFYDAGRPQAEAAACTMRFYISEPQGFSVLVAAGTRVTDTSGRLTWETTDDAYIPLGEVSADVPAKCQSPGAVGNGYAAGQINSLRDSFPYFESCENITESGGGHDTATDSEYYKLMRASMDAYSTAGASGAYEYFAKQVSTEIADVVANRPEPGHVNIYALMKDGSIAGDEVKNNVYEACSAETVRPLTDYVSVVDCEYVDYEVDITYYIQSGTSKNATEIRGAVEAAVAEFTTWQSSKLGRDINKSRLGSLVMGTGIKRLEIRAPAFTVLSEGADGTAPQVARLTNVRIIDGGYELE